MDIDPEYQKAVNELDVDKAKALLLFARGKKARDNNNLEGYKHFHWCIFGHELPRHAEKWIVKYFEAWNRPMSEGMRGVMNKAARGMAKSTETIGFVLFQIGHNPVFSNLIIQDIEDNTKKWGKFLADTIAENKGWKAAFPDVVPDEKRGWSMDGYNVYDKRVEYGEWITRVSGDHKGDPTILAVPVSSGSIGKHPTGFLVIDDIHTEKNTASKTEMLSVVRKVKADIVPTMNRPGRKPCMLVAYTPWNKEDAYTVLEESGVFDMMVTPAYVEAEKGVEFDGKTIKLTWPKIYTVVELRQNLKLLGRREFARQVLCDLEQAKSGSMPFYSFTHSAVNLDWYMIGGADPTSFFEETGDIVKKRSHFALAYLAKLPQGGAVVVDGVLEQCSLGEAETHIMDAQTRFPRWTHTRVEDVGVGKIFIQTVRKHAPGLHIVASNLQGFSGGRVRNKRDRIDTEMMPWFENGTVRISTGDTPFLNALRRGFDEFYELDKNDPAWDAMDSVYHALKGIPEVLKITADDELPSVMPKERESIFAGLRDHRG